MSGCRRDLVGSFSQIVWGRGLRDARRAPMASESAWQRNFVM